MRRSLVITLCITIGAAPSPMADDTVRRHRSVERGLAVPGASSSPAAARLLLTRSTERARAGDWGGAAEDLWRARELRPRWSEVELAAARAMLSAGMPRRALEAAGRARTKGAPDSATCRLEGRALALLGRHEEAAARLELALSLAERPTPERVLECVRAIESARGTEAALATLSAAIETLGPVPSLEDEALRAERELGRWDDALARVDREIRRAARQDSARRRRAELLEARERASRPTSPSDAVRSAPPSGRPDTVRAAAAAETAERRRERRDADGDGPFALPSTIDSADRPNPRPRSNRP